MTPLEVNRLFNKMGVTSIYMKVCLFSSSYQELDTYPSEGYAKCTLIGMVADYLNINYRLHQHLSHLIQRYPMSFFTDPQNVRSFIDGYADYLKKLETLTLEETGVSFYV